MSYVIGQKVFNTDSSIDSVMSPLTDADIVASVKQLDDSTFDDVKIDSHCLTFVNKLSSSNCYYIRFKIKKNTYRQQYNIFLRNSEDLSTNSKQFLKTITIDKASSSVFSDVNNWIEVCILFSANISGADIITITPVLTTDYLQYHENTYIVYENAFMVKNILNDITNIVKIGVQSRPGFRMSINKEEILIGRRGVYEFRNDTLRINFFSPIFTSASKYDFDLTTWEETETSEDKKYFRLNIGKDISTYQVDYFTLDYMCEEGDKNGGV